MLAGFTDLRWSALMLCITSRTTPSWNIHTGCTRSQTPPRCMGSPHEQRTAHAEAYPHWFSLAGCKKWLKLVSNLQIFLHFFIISLQCSPLDFFIHIHKILIGSRVWIFPISNNILISKILETPHLLIKRDHSSDLISMTASNFRNVDNLSSLNFKFLAMVVDGLTLLYFSP